MIDAVKCEGMEPYEGPFGAVHRMIRFKMHISVCVVVTD